MALTSPSFTLPLVPTTHHPTEPPTEPPTPASTRLLPVVRDAAPCWPLEVNAPQEQCRCG